MQPTPFAPPPSPPAKKGTPLLHCAAGASIWYIAWIVTVVVANVRTQSEWDNLAPALVIGGVFWVITTVVTWLILMRAKIAPWVLIPLTIPVYLVVWMVIYGIIGAIKNVYLMLLYNS
ncbi:hypothetical protein ACFOWZ_31050 [Lentzea rhizosphaerae]|jgi:hypothetical protein|uniref:Uncharacterized protein n=1 Tax=Lentzea rhizosphaerae TaxID=2041025 RepID=A0ABV8C1S2_9PSEU